MCSPCLFTKSKSPPLHSLHKCLNSCPVKPPILPSFPASPLTPQHLLLLPDLTSSPHTRGASDYSRAAGDCPAPAEPFPCLAIDTGGLIPRGRASNTKRLYGSCSQSEGSDFAQLPQNGWGKAQGSSSSAPFLSPRLKTSPAEEEEEEEGSEEAGLLKNSLSSSLPLFKFIYSTAGDIMIAGA